MKAFVTGSTGLLGSNLVHQLLEAGYEVKALVRSPEKARKQFGDLPIHYIQGDMEDIAAFAHELRGMDVLFHTAAYFREYYGLGDHWALLEKINVHGTIELMTQAEAAGVKKAIYVSSTSVITNKANGSAGDESDLLKPEEIDNLYARSKILAENAIMDWLKTHKMPLVLILPSGMFGPRDAAPTSAGRLILDFLAGSLPMIPYGGFSVVDARDVAAGMIAALEKGKSGERYILNNRYHSLEDILTMLEKLTGRPKPAMKMPYAAGIAFAYFAEFIGRITGKSPLTSVSAMRLLGWRREVTAAKARRELGFVARPMEETLADELQWYLDNGYVPNAPEVKLKAVKA